MFIVEKNEQDEKNSGDTNQQDLDLSLEHLIEKVNPILGEFGFELVEGFGVDSCEPIWTSQFIVWKSETRYLLFEKQESLQTKSSSMTVSLGKSPIANYLGWEARRNSFNEIAFETFEDVEGCEQSSLARTPEECIKKLNCLLQNEVFLAIVKGEFWFNYDYDPRDMATIQGYEIDLKQSLKLAKEKHFSQ